MATEPAWCYADSCISISSLVTIFGRRCGSRFMAGIARRSGRLRGGRKTWHLPAVFKRNLTGKHAGAPQCGSLSSQKTSIFSSGFDIPLQPEILFVGGCAGGARPAISVYFRIFSNSSGDLCGITNEANLR